MQKNKGHREGITPLKIPTLGGGKYVIDSEPENYEKFNGKRRGLNLQLCPKVGHSDLVFTHLILFLACMGVGVVLSPRPIPRRHRKGSGELVHPVPRIWGALILD